MDVTVRFSRHTSHLQMKPLKHPVPYASSCDAVGGIYAAHELFLPHTKLECDLASSSSSEFMGNTEEEKKF